MHGHTSFEVKIDGNDDNVKAINDVIKGTITDERFDEGSEIEIEETYKCVDLEERTGMAIKMTKSAADASFEINGVIDTSESAGELMDFSFVYDAEKLVRKSSDWYIETCIEDYESYDEFIDEWEDEAGDLSEEEFEDLRDENEFVFFVEAEGGTVVMTEVPLSHVVTIDC